MSTATLLPIEPFPARKRRRQHDDSKKKKEKKKNVEKGKQKSGSKSDKLKRKLDIDETKSKDKKSSESTMSQISKLEETIQALDAEIRDVTDKLEKKTREKVTDDGSAETMKSAIMTTTTERGEESTYYPMNQENVSSNHSVSVHKEEKKIRIKLPQKKVEKPKIQPYEFPLTEPLPTLSSAFEKESEITTIVYAIPYVPDEEEELVRKKYRRF